MVRLLLALIAAVTLQQAYASATRTIDADAITSSDKTKTYALPSVTGQLVGGHVVATPTGSVDGVNVTFTIPSTPVATAAVLLYLDGILLEQGGGEDYTISGTTITMNTAPALGQSLKAVYHRQ